MLIQSYHRCVATPRATGLASRAGHGVVSHGSGALLLWEWLAIVGLVGLIVAAIALCFVMRAGE